MSKQLSFEDLKELFSNKVYLLEMGSGKLARQYNTTPDVIKAVKKEVRKTPDVKEKAAKTFETGLYEVEETDSKKVEVYKTDKKIATLEEFIAFFKPDLTKWEIKKWRQNYWSGYIQVRVEYELKKQEDVFQEEFISFLKTYEPLSKTLYSKDVHPDLSKSCLILNKQDAHLNRYDIGGKNDIKKRFANLESKIQTIVEKANLSTNVDKILYVVGSDAFNSEFTGMTTKGTPQVNIGNFWETFEQICQHEISIINYLLTNCKNVEILFISGNHDEFVGWHMVKWLEAYYREEQRLAIDTSPDYRKYVKFSNSAFMFNHGDTMKAEKLASIFPIEFKTKWSSCDNFYIFTGDKHHLLAKDMLGIQYYQLPAFTNTKSLWEDKNGHIGTKGEIVAFLVEEGKGITDIYKSQI